MYCGCYAIYNGFRKAYTVAVTYSVSNEFHKVMHYVIIALRYNGKDITIQVYL